MIVRGEIPRSSCVHGCNLGLCDGMVGKGVCDCTALIDGVACNPAAVAENCISRIGLVENIMSEVSGAVHAEEIEQSRRQICCIARLGDGHRLHICRPNKTRRAFYKQINGYMGQLPHALLIVHRVSVVVGHADNHGVLQQISLFKLLQQLREEIIEQPDFGRVLRNLGTAVAVGVLRVLLQRICADGISVSIRHMCIARDDKVEKRPVCRQQLVLQRRIRQHKTILI